MAFYMEDMSVLDMKNAMQKTKTVIIPVGVVEQHGYHLTLSTDIKNSVGLTKAAGDRLNAVVAPSVNYCFSGGELLGTVNVSPNAFGIYISEIVAEFVRMGFENIICLLGHAGTDNRISLENSLKMILRRNHDIAEKVTISLVEVWKLSPTWLSGFSMEPEHDFHAGMMETSLMLHLYPDDVRPDYVMDEEYYAKMMRTDQDWFEKRTKPVDHPFVIETVSQRDEIEVGVMGLPELSSKELGEKITNEMIDNLVEFVDLLNNRKNN